MNRIITSLRARHVAAASLVFGLAGALAQAAPAGEGRPVRPQCGHDLWLASLKWVAEAK
jgi:hypothetical protein